MPRTKPRLLGSATCAARYGEPYCSGSALSEVFGNVCDGDEGVDRGFDAPMVLKEVAAMRLASKSKGTLATTAMAMTAEAMAIVERPLTVAIFSLCRTKSENRRDGSSIEFGPNLMIGVVWIKTNDAGNSNSNGQEI